MPSLKPPSIKPKPSIKTDPFSDFISSLLTFGQGGLRPNAVTNFDFEAALAPPSLGEGSAQGASTEEREKQLPGYGRDLPDPNPPKEEPPFPIGTYPIPTHEEDTPRTPILIPWEIPGEDDPIQDIPEPTDPGIPEPSLPAEDQPQPTGDVPDDEDEDPLEPIDIPEYPECSNSPGVQRLLGIPPCSRHGLSFEIQTSKTRKNKLPKSTKRRKSRYRKNTDQTGLGF